MLKYAVKQWDANKGRLEEAIRKYPDIKTIFDYRLIKFPHQSMVLVFEEWDN